MLFWELDVKGEGVASPRVSPRQKALAIERNWICVFQSSSSVVVEKSYLYFSEIKSVCASSEWQYVMSHFQDYVLNHVSANY